MKFIISDKCDENTIIENEVNSSLLVRANMSANKAIEEALRRKEKIILKPKPKKKNTYIENNITKPIYCEAPTPEEIIETFNLIMKSIERTGTIDRIGTRQSLEKIGTKQSLE